MLAASLTSALGRTFTGLAVMAVALGGLLAMVIRLIEPGFILSLLAYAGLFIGALLTFAGVRLLVGR